VEGNKIAGPLPKQSICRKGCILPPVGTRSLPRHRRILKAGIKTNICRPNCSQTRGRECVSAMQFAEDSAPLCLSHPPASAFLSLHSSAVSLCNQIRTLSLSCDFSNGNKSVFHKSRLPFNVSHSEGFSYFVLSPFQASFNSTESAAVPVRCFICEPLKTYKYSGEAQCWQLLLNTNHGV
jgi:hypothetical protein